MTLILKSSMVKPATVGAVEADDVVVEMKAQSFEFEKIRPENQILLACASTAPDSQTIREAKALISPQTDWAYIASLAGRSWITPLVCRNILRFFSDLVPAELIDECNHYCRAHAHNNLFQTAELIRVLRLFDAKKLTAIPLKGPVLSALAYGDLSLRDFCDLDILVRKRDFDRAFDLLISQGYRVFHSPKEADKLPDFASRKKDHSLVSPDGRVRIELHWRLSGMHFDLPLDLSRLWDRMETVSMAGASVRSLPINDLMLYLSMHGTRHRWMRLAWICDIAELVRIRKDINWEELIRQAEELGNKRSLALGLLLAHDMLGTQLPPVVLQWAREDAVIEQLASMVSEYLLCEDPDSLDISYWRKYHLKVKERFRERARLHLHYYLRYLRIAVLPNSRDEELISLPESLHFVYYLLRPFRLMKEYGGRLFTRPKR